MVFLFLSDDLDEALFFVWLLSQLKIEKVNNYKDLLFKYSYVIFKMRFHLILQIKEFNLNNLLVFRKFSDIL